jgi:hypothetical protein
MGDGRRDTLAEWEVWRLIRHSFEPAPHVSPARWKAMSPAALPGRMRICSAAVRTSWTVSPPSADRLRAEEGERGDGALRSREVAADQDAADASDASYGGGTTVSAERWGFSVRVTEISSAHRASRPV